MSGGAGDKLTSAAPSAELKRYDFAFAGPDDSRTHSRYGALERHREMVETPEGRWVLYRDLEGKL